MFSIRTRIVFATSIVFASILIFLSIWVLRAFERALVDALDAQLDRFAAILETEVGEQTHENLFPMPQDLKDVTPETIRQAQFRILDSLGRTVFSDSFPAKLPTEAWSLNLRQGQSHRSVLIAGTQYRRMHTVIEVQDQRRYSLDIVAPLAAVESSVALLRTLFILGIPVAILLLGGATSLVIRRAFRPIHSMIATANRITAHDLSGRLPDPKSQDEIHALATTLNSMIERLQSAFSAQKQFIAELSHEYRTPLTIIRSELEFAAARTTDPQSQESIALATSEIDRLKRMTDDLLLLMRLDSTEQLLIRSPVRLDELLAETCRRMSSVARSKTIGLDLQIDEVVEVSGDAGRLLRAVSNLLDNAIKYSPVGSTVTLRLRLNDSTARISIIDQGAGIRPDELNNLFQRVSRRANTHASSPGYGLGLAIARRIVELHGGSITVRSQPGEGSEFCMEFPLSESPS
jgi:signal transduction histidine kinase